MRWIELIGPSGVGKTALLEELANHRKPESNWITYAELVPQLKQRDLQRAREHMNGSLKGGKKLVMQLVMDYGLLLCNDNLKDIVVDQFIQTFQGRPDGVATSERTYRLENMTRMHVEGVVGMSGISGIMKARFIEFYMSLINKYLRLDAYALENIVIFDELFFRNNAGIPGLVRQGQWLEEYQRGENAEPVAIIGCISDGEVIHERLRRRREEGDIDNLLLEDGDDAAIQRKVDLDLRSYELRKRAIEMIGVPFHEVRLNGAMSDAVDPLKGFLESLA